MKGYKLPTKLASSYHAVSKHVFLAHKQRVVVSASHAPVAYLNACYFFSGSRVTQNNCRARLSTWPDLSGQEREVRIYSGDTTTTQLTAGQVTHADPSLGPLEIEHVDLPLRGSGTRAELGRDGDSVVSLHVRMNREVKLVLVVERKTREKQGDHILVYVLCVDIVSWSKPAEFRGGLQTNRTHEPKI